MGRVIWKNHTSCQSGEQLPLGILVQNEAKQRGIPTVIVTSTYHHDDAFKAIRSDITAPYIDTLVDDRKDWKSGIEKFIAK